MAYDPILLGLSNTSAALSMLGGILMIGSFFGFRELRSQRSRLVLFLSIADVGEAFGWLMYAFNSNQQACFAQALILQYFIVSSAFWTLCLSIHSYLAVISKSHKRMLFSKSPYEVWFHAVCWGFPAVLLSYPLVRGMFGAQGGGKWCYLIGPDRAKASLYIMYIENIFCAVASGVFYSMMRARVRANAASTASVLLTPMMASTTTNVSRSASGMDFLDSSFGGGTDTNNSNVSSRRNSNSAILDVTSESSLMSNNATVDGSVYLYVLAMVISWVPAAINRAQQAIYEQPVYALYCLHALCQPLQGFLDFLIYGLSENIVAPTTFHAMLSNSTALAFFKKYLYATFCCENMEFYEEVVALVRALTTWSKAVENPALYLDMNIPTSPSSNRLSMRVTSHDNLEGDSTRSSASSAAGCAPCVFAVPLDLTPSRTQSKQLPHLVGMLQDLVTNFIMSDGSFSLNLSAKCRQTALDRWNILNEKFPFSKQPAHTLRPDREISDPLVRAEFGHDVKALLQGPFSEVQESLTSDSFSRFLSSSQYISMVHTLKMSENLQQKPLVVALVQQFAGFWNNKDTELLEEL